MSSVRVSIFARIAAGVVGVHASMALMAAAPAEIHIPGARVIPESITSSKNGTIYIGSVVPGVVFRAEPGSDTAHAWILSGTGGLQHILGVFADDASNTLWVCSRGQAIQSPVIANPGPSALLTFNLKTGAFKQRYVLPTPGAGCNDMAVGGNGTLYATDSNNMQIVRLTKGGKTLEVWSPDGVFGPVGGTLDGISVIGSVVYANVLNTSKLFGIPVGKDGSAGKPYEVKLNRPIERPDGMRSYRNGLLVLERNTAGQLSRIDFKGDSGTIKVLKEGYPDDAVAVTVVGHTAWVLEAQFKAIQLGTGYVPKAFHATSFDLK